MVVASVILLLIPGVPVCAGAPNHHISSMPGCFTPTRATGLADPEEERWL